MRTRDDVIDAAIAVVEQEGADALTTVAVAGRLGITQSAVYRHVRDLNDLLVAVADRVAEKLTQILNSVLTDPFIRWGEAGDIARCARALVDVFADERFAFEFTDRTQFVEGPLGDGVRKWLSEGRRVVARILEEQWRADFGGGDVVLARPERALINANARLMQEEVFAVARITRSVRYPGGRAALAHLLHLNLHADWLVFVSMLNERTGLEPLLPLAAVENARTLADIRNPT